MKVKEIVTAALKLVGRGDIAAKLAAGEELDGNDKETLDIMVYCFNSAEYELLRYYFPKKITEEITGSGRKFYLESFSRRPFRVLSVKKNGLDLDFSARDGYILAEADKAIFEYLFVPEKKNLDGECEYTEAEIGELLPAYGAASEYCLINGEIKAAEVWEGKYRQSIDCARKTCRPAIYVPPRRWV